MYKVVYKSNGSEIGPGYRVCRINETSDKLEIWTGSEFSELELKAITPPEPVVIGEEPAPVKPTPVQPTPVEPTPAQPAPVLPTLVEPTPAQPAPVQPTITDYVLGPKTGKVHYIEPGSSTSYRGLFGKVAAGDTIVFKRGKHTTPIDMWNQKKESTVYVKAEVPGETFVAYAEIRQGCGNLHIEGITFLRDDAVSTSRIGVRVYDQAVNVSFENCEVLGRADSRNYLNWHTLEQWQGLGRGIDNGAKGGFVRNCRVIGNGSGISAGSGQVVENCEVRGFAADAYRGFGNAIFRNNFCCHPVNNKSGNHDDMFQSFNLAVDPPMYDMILEGNTFMTWLPDAKFPQELQSLCQGIGMFDGFWNRLTIRNNLIMTDHWHGLSVYGARDSVIEDNIVLNILGNKITDKKRPWLMVTSHKNGKPSERVTVRNNKALNYSMSDKTIGLVFENNERLTVERNAALIQELRSRWDR